MSNKYQIDSANFHVLRLYHNKRPHHNKQNVEPWKRSTSWGNIKVMFTCWQHLIIEIVSQSRCFVMWYINVTFIKFIKFTTYEIVLIYKFSTGFSFMRHLIHEIWRDTYIDVIVERMSEVRNGTSRNTENENKRHKYI
jgi:hypothetical protein